MMCFKSIVSIAACSRVRACYICVCSRLYV